MNATVWAVDVIEQRSRTSIIVHNQFRLSTFLIRVTSFPSFATSVVLIQLIHRFKSRSVNLYTSQHGST
jgi:hypothetical protein